MRLTELKCTRLKPVYSLCYPLVAYLNGSNLVGIINMKITHRSKSVLIHTACWLIYIAYAILMTYLVRPKSIDFLDLLISYILGTGLFYFFAIVIIPLFSRSGKWLIGLFSSAVLFIIYCCLRFLSKEGFSSFADVINPVGTYLKAPFVYFCIFVYLEYFIYAIGYWFAMDSIQKSKNIAFLKQQQLEVENQFLKEQLSPHFLYNTLSYFYSKTLVLDQNLAEGLLILTDILRYSLKTDVEKVPLELEVLHIDNLIKINNLRFNQGLKLNFTKIYDADAQHLISPHILITLVENAFKYGNAIDKDNPIQINLKSTKQGIYFEINNKKATGFKTKSTGIGIISLRKRLDFLYKQDYLLEIKDEAMWYNVKLSIKGL
jgi:two-component system LytT family sensor kinase